MIPIIACAGRRDFVQIALESGFEIGFGIQTKGALRTPVYFMDQDWKKPNRMHYMELVQQHNPVMATVLDLEREAQFDEVLAWMFQVAPLVQRDIVVIPKYNGAITELPREILGRRVVLGFSVPTAYGATLVPIDEFAGWPIHLLGGSPHKQYHYFQQLSIMAEVVSIDGNYQSKMATRFCQFFDPVPTGKWKNKYWPTLTEADGAKWTGNGPVEAYRRSCRSIMEFWSTRL